MNYPVPAHTVVTYTNDVESGRYLKDPAMVPFLKMPAWVRISKTWDPGRRGVGAELMADGPKKKGEGLHAGLIPTGVVGWYVTDVPDTYAGRICKNTVLFHFTPDARRLIVFFFTGLPKHDIPERVRFALQVIPSLKVPPANIPPSYGPHTDNTAAVRP